jgi:hypothetical protein
VGKNCEQLSHDVGQLHDIKAFAGGVKVIRLMHELEQRQTYILEDRRYKTSQQRRQ